MSDSGNQSAPPSPHPCSTIWLRDAAWFFGETARPFAIYVTAAAAAKTILMLALKVNSTEATLYVGAVFLGVGTLYGVKGVESIFKTRADADVQKETVKGGGAL